MAYGCCLSHFPADPICGSDSARPKSAHGMLSALLFYPALSAPIIPLGLFVYILLPGTFSLQHLLPSADSLSSGLRHNISIQERLPHLPQTRQSPNFLAPPPLFSMPSLKLLSGYLPIIIPGPVCLHCLCMGSDGICLLLQPSNLTTKVAASNSTSRHLRDGWASASASDRALVTMLLEAVDSFHFRGLIVGGWHPLRSFRLKASGCFAVVSSHTPLRDVKADLSSCHADMATCFITAEKRP